MNPFRNIATFYNRSFKAKVFLTFFLLLLAASVSFTTFFIYHEYTSQTDDLIKDGLSLARLVAYNSRLGVYSEDPKHFKDSVEGAMGREEVMSITIFDLEGKTLLGKGAAVFPADIREVRNRFFDDMSPVFFPYADWIDFWAPVVASAHQGSEESLFFVTAPKRPVPIGFVRIAITKKLLHRNFMAVLYKSTVISFIFILAGSLVIFFVTRSVTKPLNRLAEGIKALDNGAASPEVSIESDDEIGRLTDSFNRMARSLEQKNKEKRQLMEKLSQAHRLEAIGTFAAGIAHDFSNILAIIQSNSELADRKSPEYLKSHVQRILGATKRGNELITRLLHFKHETPPAMKPVNLGSLVQETVRLTRALIDERIDINVTIDPDLGETTADEGQIPQVIINLVKNAQDAILENIGSGLGSPKGKGFLIEIVLSSVDVGDEYCTSNPQASAGQYAVISVKDNGCGMDPHTALHVFEPFFSTKPVGRGTGLGLSTAFGIITGHGGWIDVSSKPGEGSSFDVYIPKASGFLDKKLLEHSEGKVYGGSETVLLVDDERDIISAAREELEELGYKVVLAESGTEALDILHAGQTVDIVVLDQVMPGISGTEVLGEILKLDPRPKVIICSGKDLGQQTAALKGVPYIRKPFSLYALANTVRHILGKGNGTPLSTGLSRLKLYSVAESSLTHKGKIESSDDVYRLFRHVASEPRENLIAVLLDRGNNIIGYETVSTGTTDQATVHPKEIVRLALMANACSIILLHNHPSGDLDPSQEDIVITAAVMEACMIMDLQLLDHLIIASQGYVSMSEEGYFDK